MTYPSLWGLLMKNNVPDYYSDMHMFGILFTVFILILLMTLLLKKKMLITDYNYLKLAFLFVYSCVFFLPNMHERYGYVYIMLGQILTIVDVKYIFLYLPLLAIDLMIYSNYLFRFPPNWQMLSAVNLLCYSVCAFLILKEVHNQLKTEIQ